MTIFLGTVIVALEKVSVAVEHLPMALYVCPLPVCLYPGAVGERDNSESFFPAVFEETFIDSAISIEIRSLAMLLALLPASLVGVPVGVVHASLAMLDIIFPDARVGIAVAVEVGAMALLTPVDDALEALPIPEETNSPAEQVVVPLPEVEVSLSTKENPPAFPFLAGWVDLSPVTAPVKVFLESRRGAGRNLGDELLQLAFQSLRVLY